MLSDITVAELGTHVSTAYCGKLLRDLGAAVVRLEPSTGNPLRAGEPAYAAFLHAGKRSVTADSPDQVRAALASMVGRVDVILCDPDRLDVATAARAADPGVLVATISAYGTDGPFAGRPANDFTLQAESGISLLHPTGDRPPVPAGVELSALAGAAAAAAGIAAALLMSEAGASPTAGTEPDVDVSRFESVAGLLQFPWLGAQIEHHNPYPLPQMAVPGLELAKDGWVCAVAVTPPQWVDFKRMAGVPELDEARFDTLTSRIANSAETTELVRRFTLQHTVEELVELGARFRVPITPVGTPTNLPTLAPYAARGSYVTTGAGVVQPRPPFRYDGDNAEPAPLAAIGAHDSALLGSTPLGTTARERPTGGGATATPALPLAGLRVLEIGTFQAGPLVGSSLASLGADVIKIESVKRPDLIRFAGALTIDRYWERANAFVSPNLGKRELTIDFTEPEGMAIVRQLIERADVVLDNFLPRVLDDRGLDYEGVRAIRPDVLMVRLPAWGSSGPWRDRPGFTYSVDATSGLSDLTGYPDGDPMMTGTIVDPLAALFSTFATLAAIRQRRITGRGRLVEVPLCDIAAQLTARAVVAASATGVEPRRRGNQSHSAAPQGAYRAADGQWVAVSVASDAQWAALAELPDAAEWAADARFVTLAGRIEHRDELDERLVAFCAGGAAEAVAAQLRKSGVPAAVHGVGRDFHLHPQLVARGRVFEVGHGVLGAKKYLGPPARLAAAPQASAQRGAPLFGEHNREILGELGFDDAAIDAMYEAGSIGDSPFGLPFER
jgi:crotonobetainyl-CoA:carnitine CoA-transferase CaiB-like acyl-CoA transferase